MLRILSYLFIFFISLTRYACTHDLEHEQLRINLIAPFHLGGGMKADQHILTTALEELGHFVQAIDCHQPKVDGFNAHINIFIERIEPQWFSSAQLNWFIPNPEWYPHDLKLLDNIDLILCRTKEVERIFYAKHKKTYYLGFTSLDCYQEGINKDFSLCLHLAGKSGEKGTPAVIDVWSQDLSLPNLLVIRHNIASPLHQENLQWISEVQPLDTIRHYQNCCGIHLCPSLTEGFGHYIMEGMSTGAIIITTDAPPMNEFIRDPRCLIPYKSTSQQSLATTYYINPEQLNSKIKSLSLLPSEELQAMSLKNREAYLEGKKEFHKRLKKLLTIIQKSVSFQK